VQYLYFSKFTQLAIVLHNFTLCKIHICFTLTLQWFHTTWNDLIAWLCIYILNGIHFVIWYNDSLGLISTWIKWTMFVKKNSFSWNWNIILSCSLWYCHMTCDIIVYWMICKFKSWLDNYVGERKIETTFLKS